MKNDSDTCTPALFGATGAAVTLLLPALLWLSVAASHADNPVIQTKFTVDPAPMVSKNTVYLYTGHDEDDATNFKMHDWLCYTSTDMANWTDRGSVASLNDFKWADAARSGWGGFANGAWASQCLEHNWWQFHW